VIGAAPRARRVTSDRLTGSFVGAVEPNAHYRLSANVENLVLQGTADLQGYGNSQANTLVGNAGVTSWTVMPAPTP
jgi:hypothetical protein